MKHSTGGTEFEVDEENLCESTRLALADEKPLNRAQEAHLKTCEFCRRFQNETEILKKDLAALDIDPLIKNGVSLADAVMEEVEKQAAFRIKSSTSPKHRLFRHAGLAAACLVVFVLAAPTVFNTICAQKKFDTLPNEAALPQTMFSAGNADKAVDDKVSSELAASDENAYLTDKGANDKAFSDAADTVFPDESTEAETKVPLLTVQFAGTNDISEKQNSSDSQSGGTNAAVSSSSDNLTTESTNNVSGPFLMLKPSSENATPAVGGDTTNEYVSDRYSAENSAENSTNNDNSTANGVDGVLPPNNQITAENSAADTASEEVPDPSSALTGSGGGGGGNSGGGGEKKFSPSSVHAPETDDTSNSFDTGESDNLDDRSTVSALSLVETAYEAAVARFGTRYAISTDNASVTTLSENRLYVDFSVEATAVHLQVFMTFTDGEWRISSDADGNVQIFEVTELYNYVG